MGTSTDVTVRPADSRSWDDVEAVFGANGGCEGCWCMYWRATSGPEYARMQGEPAREEFAALVRGGEVPGLLAYRDDEPAGWCAIAPRPEYVRLRASRTLRPEAPDDAAVWSLPCFYVKAGHRRAGIADTLVTAALDRARECGGEVVEAYPNDADHRRYGAAELHMGTVDLFARHGFDEVDRPSPGRVIMRRELA